MVVTDPAEPARVVYSCAPNTAHVDQAVGAARRALPAWSGLPQERRFAVLRRFGEIAKAGTAQMASVIANEVGKAMWECKAEAGILAGKVDITLDPAATSGGGGLARVSDFELPLSPTRRGRCIFKPHGVMAVVGPFNFPAHLPNGHIVPALAAGNTVVFKPSEKAPGAGQLLVEWYLRAIHEELGETPQARACGGTVNLVQGGGEIAAGLCGHPGIDGVAFTGSWPVARKIALANIDRPGRMLAFELGGSNPAVVMDDADLRLAALEVARSAFNTTGQRCTCTRRLIVHEAVERKLIALVGKIASNLVIGHPRSSPVFTGPIISRAALDAALNFQSAARRSGAAVLMEAAAIDTPTRGHFISPSIIRVDRFVADPLDHPVQAGEPIDPGADIEVFGPVLRYTTVTSIEGAIQQANATRYGLAASIFTQSAAHGERFIRECRAGCINVNTGTAGASSKLPFGGLGLSGNHRPAGSFALDYCASPVACMVERSSAPPAVSEGMRFDEEWLA